MFWLTSVRKTYQTTETTPIHSVEVLGVRKRGWMRAKYFGIAPCEAIERVVLEVGRIVVCAEAEASTAMISSLSHGDPSTASPRALSTSPEFLMRNSGPWNACAAIETTT